MSTRDFTGLGGWSRRPDEVAKTLKTMPRPLFSQAASHIAGSGEGQTVLLYQAYKEVNQGRYIDYPAQEIGDCVSQGFGHGTDLLAAVQIAIGKRVEVFKETATEGIYGMARVDIGGQRGSNSDGAVGAWAAKAVSQIGTLNREDLGPYSGRRSKEWGAKGVPAELARNASNHKVRTASLVTRYEELEDALFNGYPVAVCSDQGFTLERDRDGFCQARGTWMHCMLFVGVRAGDRPGACVLQSWGSNVPSGPTALDQPSYSFWADRRVVERMLAQQDSWSLSSFDGYPGQAIPERWSYAGFA